MTLRAKALAFAEAFPLPDAVTRGGIDWLVGRTRRQLMQADSSADRSFAAEMARLPIALNTRDANVQHYDIPSAFFALILGPRRKYSCCLYETEDATLATAEEAALRETAAHADLHDGQTILELGCGWGSLSLWMAEHYPAARITAVSNSASQRAYIREQIAARGLLNLDVITADMNVFTPPQRFDRIVSVEMFEHMANWQALLARIRTWVTPDGKLFLHVFTHRQIPYRFDVNDKSDWIAQHFFSGGVMPSHNLIRQFEASFIVELEWRWVGYHYRRTAEDWLANFDRNIDAIDRILREHYGTEAALWRRRWRLFFLSTAGLFGHAGGGEWGVSHYRLHT